MQRLLYYIILVAILEKYNKFDAVLITNDELI